ncbi:hypothetical protein C3473_23540 [Mycobacterium kansasii]|nr:hypothetical protein C3473_23540 [Mycobacterium kansasii]
MAAWLLTTDSAHDAAALEDEQCPVDLFDDHGTALVSAVLVGHRDKRRAGGRWALGAGQYLNETAS